MKWYTGVGSRETPQDIQDLMARLAYKLASEGYGLRSGGAEGADQAFERGWWSHRMSRDIGYSANDYECYIPWSGFEDHTATSHDGCCILPSDVHVEVERQAEKIASEIHPAWGNCTQGARKLHTRNVYQVLGRHLDAPSSMLVCWAKIAKGGNISGGTATAWNLAKKHGVPCFNLADPEHFQRITKYLED